MNELKTELKAIRERAAQHAMPSPCAVDDACTCCALGHDNARLVTALEGVVALIEPQWRNIEYDRNSLIDDLRTALGTLVEKSPELPDV